MTRAKAVVLCCVVFAISINVWYRLNTARLVKFDRVARDEVYEGLGSRIAADVSRLHPGLNEGDRAELAGSTFREYLRQDAAQVRRAVAERAGQIRSFWLDEQGWPYLLENDSFRWQRRVENLLRSGHAGTRRDGGREYDELMDAPSRSALIERQPLHFFLGAAWYRLLNFFLSGITIGHALALMPVALSAVAVGAVLLISRMAGISYPASCAAAVAAGIARPALMRTSLGWYDTDMYNMFMPALIVACAARAVSAQALRRMILWCAAAGLLAGIYSALWNVWWWVVYLAVAGLVLRRDLKRSLVSAAFFGVFASAAVVIISGPDILWKLFWEPWWDWTIKKGLALEGFWPGISFSVLEIRPMQVHSIAAGLGGWAVFAGAAAGLLLFVVKYRAQPVLIFLFIWIAGMLAASLSAQRFFIFLLLPAGVCFGRSLDALYHLLRRALARAPRDVLSRFAGAAGVIYIAGAAVPMFQSRDVSFVSGYNDAWHALMKDIDGRLPADAVIASDWPVGDWIMTVGRRSTLTCAGWQHTPRPYWIARALLTADEREARGILRMLNSGGNGAFEALAAAFAGDRMRALETVNVLLKMERPQGEAYLRESVNDAAAARVSALMYGAAHPGYILVHHLQFASLYEEDTLASWDFRRYALWELFKRSSRDAFTDAAGRTAGCGRDEAGSLYDTLSLTSDERALSWIAPRARRMYAPFAAAPKAAAGIGPVPFANGVIYDARGGFAYWQESSGRLIAAGATKLISETGISTRVNPAGSTEYSILIYDKGDVLDAVVVSRALAESVFGRLYLLDGEGLTLFKKVLETEKSEFDVRMLVYKISWAEN